VDGAGSESSPWLVSLIGGGNDILRPGADIESISGRLERAVVVLRAAGADVLLGTGTKAGGALAFTRAKTGQFNANIWSIAHRHGAFVLDLWGLRALFDLRLWHEDRLHLVPDGHLRVANAALVALGLMPDDPNYDRPLPPAGPRPLADRITADAHWAREYVVPWVQRRVAHTSSGDGRSAKWPTPQPWPPAAQ
jgi:hypothetical protein